MDEHIGTIMKIFLGGKQKKKVTEDQKVLCHDFRCSQLEPAFSPSSHLAFRSLSIRHFLLIDRRR